MIYEGEDILGVAGLDAIGGGLSAEQAVSTKQPQPCFIRWVELVELVREPLQCQQLLKFGWLWVDVSLLPAGDGLRCGVEQLSYFAATYSGVGLDRVKTGGDGSGHRWDTSFPGSAGSASNGAGEGVTIMRCVVAASRLRER